MHKGTLIRYKQYKESLYLVHGFPEAPGRNQQFELRPGGRNELSVRTTRGVENHLHCGLALTEGGPETGLFFGPHVETINGAP